MSSAVACVLCDRTEKRLVSSTKVTTEQTLVSLNSAMKSLTTGGITIRTAWGTMMRRRASARLIPSASAASICPRGTAKQSRAVDLRLVGRVVDAETQHRRPECGDHDAHLGEKEEDEVELQHDRRAAKKLDISRRGAPCSQEGPYSRPSATQRPSAMARGNDKQDKSTVSPADCSRMSP